MRIAYVMAGLFATTVLGCADIDPDPIDPAMVDVSAGAEERGRPTIAHPPDEPDAAVPEPDAAPAPDAAVPEPDALPPPPDAAPVCGNGLVETGEECDDGNATGQDGCSATCHSEHLCCCGNGVLEPGEACDDGNQIEGDGCDSACAVEGG